MRRAAVALCLVLSLDAAAQSAQEKARLAQTDEFQTAVVKNDAAAVKRLIARGMKVDFNFNEASPRGRSGESPLTMAIGRGHLEIARILLEAGADPNRRDDHDNSPMDRARSAEAVELLLRHHADMVAFDRRGMTALEKAIERRDAASAGMLVAHGARLDVPKRGPDLFTTAAERGDKEAIRTLLAAGADPRSPPTQAIWKLIEKGDDAETARLLLGKGADPDAGDGRETLVERALFRKRWGILSALADAGAKLQPADAAACGESTWQCHSIQAARLASLDAPTLAHLKARGLDLNRVATNGHTALTSLLLEPPAPRVAALMPDGRIGPALEPPPELPRVRALLEQGADPNRRFQELTPLMLAVAVPQKPRDIADLLVDFGGRVEFEYTIPRASPDDPTVAVLSPATARASLAILREPPIRDYQGILKGMTVGPLTWLVLYKRADLATRILARERRLAPADRFVLYFAGLLGEWSFATEALKYVREVDAGDRAGVTPLLIAADDGRLDAVKALVAAGANVNARSASDWPPFWETPPSMLLDGHGHSKPRLVGGYTPLRAAKASGHAEVGRVLMQAGGAE